MSESINDTQRAEETRAVRDEDTGYRAEVERIHDEEAAAEWEHRRQVRGFPW